MNKLIVANWKMQLGLAETRQLLTAIAKLPFKKYKNELVVSPDYLNLEEAKKLLDKTPVAVASQNCASKDKAALTGEVSASNLRALGVDYVIIGHSERRGQLKEDASVIREKIEVALANSLQVILCIGENIIERRTGRARPVLSNQLRSALSGLKVKRVKDIIIAYEPIWAIGSGRALDYAEVNLMLAYIKERAKKISGKNLKTLYGGSVTTVNAVEILQQKNVAGLLVGGASLEISSLEKLLSI